MLETSDIAEPLALTADLDHALRREQHPRTTRSPRAQPERVELVVVGGEDSIVAIP
jgi:hypothetical protein